MTKKSLPELRPVFLRRLYKAMQFTGVEVRVIDLDGNVTAMRTFTPTQFINAHGWMAARSHERQHVYWRPLGPLSWCLVDDLTHGMLTLMRDDRVHPTVVVQTNPHTHDNLQAWVCIGRDLPHDVHLAACQLLADRYGADAGSAKPSQFGRVPTTFNAKPQHWIDGASAPLVKLQMASSRGINVVFSVRDEAREIVATQQDKREIRRTDASSTQIALYDDDGAPLEVYDGDEHVVTMHAATCPADFWRSWHVQPITKTDGTMDRSRTDARRVWSMRAAGVPNDTICTAIRAGSEKVRERAERSGEDAAQSLVRGLMASSTGKKSTTPVVSQTAPVGHFSNAAKKIEE